MGKACSRGSPREYNEVVKFSRRKEDAATVVTVEGSILDLMSSSALKKALGGESAPGALLVDCSRVEYLDSVIIGVLVERFLAFRREGRRLVLFGLQDGVVDLLRTTSLLSVFDVTPDLGEALALAARPVDPDAPVFGSGGEEVA